MARDFRTPEGFKTVKFGDVNTTNNLIAFKVGDISCSVSFGQDIFDIAIQRLGTIETIFDDILKYNSNELTINTDLKIGDQMYVNTNNTGNFAIKNKLKNINFVVVNNDQLNDVEVEGDFNNDFNNDFFN